MILFLNEIIINELLFLEIIQERGLQLMVQRSY